ncbi:MAG TPA: anti-sigma-D factor RsdA [Pseudonocardiaceae bacterium]
MSGRDDDEPVGYPIDDSRDGSEMAHESPADLAAVRADDALLNMLGGGGPTPSDIDGELASVLVAWRRDVYADSIKELVDTDTAMAAIRAGRRPTRHRNPLLGPVAAAAAVLVIAFSGVGLVAKSAQPGDHLWGLTQVLYSDYARSVEAAALVKTELDEANTALQEGKPMKAKASLDRAHQQLAVIAETEGRTDLTARHNELEKMLNGTSQEPTPGAAAPVLPAPVTSSTRTSTTTTTTTTQPPASASSSASTSPSSSSSWSPPPSVSSRSDRRNGPPPKGPPPNPNGPPPYTLTTTPQAPVPPPVPPPPYGG